MAQCLLMFYLWQFHTCLHTVYWNHVDPIFLSWSSPSPMPLLFPINPPTLTSSFLCMCRSSAGITFSLDTCKIHSLHKINLKLLYKKLKGNIIKRRLLREKETAKWTKTNKQITTKKPRCLLTMTPHSQCLRKCKIFQSVKTSNLVLTVKMFHKYTWFC